MPLHDTLTAVAALVAVIAMILLARFGTRLIGVVPGRGPGHGRLALEASLALDPRRRLTLVRCEGHRLLLLTGGSADVCLGWLPATTAPQAGDLS